ncbi:hypothetical protein CPC08DRAFT_704696 [Agrocybe pediades]|nr:hypothetical protein CPC08DRAFT_704696 [Agrocybe pediades]
MLRGKFNYPDLDVLDSPLLSPNPLSAVLGNVPGSAIAERIFNDPDSWEDNDAEDSDFPVDIDGQDPLAWLTEEIEKFKAGLDSARFDDSPSTPTDKDKMNLTLVETPTSGTPELVPKHRISLIGGDANAGWKGIGKKANVRPISLAALFEHSNEDFSSGMQQQLSKILESGGIPHHIRPIPHSSALSPPSTSGSSSTLDTPLQLHTASSSGRSNGESPVSVYSASATLSFLEWYGIYPDSPRLDLAARRMQPKSARLQTPVLQVPSPRHATRPSSLLSPTETGPYKKPPAKRASSVPPPGLDLPANDANEARKPVPGQDVPHSPSPVAPQVHGQLSIERSLAHEQASAVDDAERGRTLHMVAPPPYTRTPSPVPPPSRSNSNPTTPPVTSPPSRTGTPSRGNSGSQDAPRRLPSIPPEIGVTHSRPATPPQPLPPIPVHAQPQAPMLVAVGRPSAPTPVRTQSSPQPSTLPRSQSSSRAPSRSASPAASSVVARASCPSHSLQQQRPTSSIRSPLGGPAGPRTRSRASHNPSAITGSATPMSISSVTHRPPGLRL